MGLCAHNQQPVQALGPDGPNKAFRNPVRLLGVESALGLEHGVEVAPELVIVITNQKTNRLRSVAQRPRALPPLLRDPIGVGVVRAPGEVHAPTGDFDEKQHVHSLEPDGSAALIRNNWLRSAAPCQGPWAGPPSGTYVGGGDADASPVRVARRLRERDGGVSSGAEALGESGAEGIETCGTACQPRTTVNSFQQQLLIEEVNVVRDAVSVEELVVPPIDLDSSGAIPRHGGICSRALQRSA